MFSSANILKREKFCVSCGIEKNLNDFYNDRKREDGKTQDCKECRKKYRYSVVGSETQKRYLLSEKGRLFVKKYYANHKIDDARKEHCKKYREFNKEKYRGYQRKYDKSDKGKLTDKKYKSGECGKFASIKCTHKRRSLSKDVESTLTLEQWNKILFLQGNRCQMCKKRFTKIVPPTQDHIIPLSKKGSLTFENVQALCGRCNSTKNDILDRTNIITWISR